MDFFVFSTLEIFLFVLVRGTFPFSFFVHVKIPFSFLVRGKFLFRFLVRRKVSFSLLVRVFQFSTCKVFFVVFSTRKISFLVCSMFFVFGMWNFSFSCLVHVFVVFHVFIFRGARPK